MSESNLPISIAHAEHQQEMNAEPPEAASAPTPDEQQTPPNAQPESDAPIPSSPQPSDATEVPWLHSKDPLSLSEAEQPTPSSSRQNGHAYPRTTSKSPRRERQPEDGWDDSTPSDGVVLTYESPYTQVERRLVVTSAMRLRLYQGKQEGWQYVKLFTEESFAASGRLHIAPGGHKPLKSVKDNTYMFYVIEGAVNVTIHNSTYLVGPDGSFLVPRGNTYLIENISPRTAKLLFFQSREVQSTDDPLLSYSTPTLPLITSDSKAHMLLGWLLERFLKRFAKFRKVFWKWYVRTAFAVGKRLNGPRAYWTYFFLGFLIRGLLRLPASLPRIDIKLIMARS